MQDYPILYFYNQKKDHELYKKAIKHSKNLINKESRMFNKLCYNNLISMKVHNVNNLEEFNDWLLDIIKKCWSFAKNIKNEDGELEPVENLKQNYDFSMYIYSEISYKWIEEQPSIIDIAIDIGFNIAKKHLLINGNKRTSLMFMAIFLKICGFVLPYFDYSEREKYVLEKFIDVYYGHLKKMSTCDVNNECSVLNVKTNFKNFLMNHLMIDFNYLLKIAPKKIQNNGGIILKKINNDDLKYFFKSNLYREMYIFLSNT